MIVVLLYSFTLESTYIKEIFIEFSPFHSQTVDQLITLFCIKATKNTPGHPGGNGAKVH